MKTTTSALRSFLLASLAAACALGTSTAALAQRHDHDGPRRGWVMDSRYHHNHYYPSVGFYAAALPAAALAVAFGPDRFWYQSGIWYRPYGGGYRVVLPPFGAVVPVLPLDYVTLRFGGAPYYYANGVYYSAYGASPGYVVVAPPAGIDRVQPVAEAAPAAPPARPEPIIYPRNQQSAEQTEADHRDCNRWATSQPSAMDQASVFSRAVEACMDGRGYTMK